MRKPIFSIKDEFNSSRYYIYLFGIKLFSLRRATLKKVSQRKISTTQRHYKRIEQHLQKKVTSGQRLKVAFLVGLPSMFPARPIMEAMLNDRAFDVSLLIYPDLRFGEARAKTTLAAAEQEYKAAYPHLNILLSPLNKDEDTIRLRDIADIVFPPVPYDISHRKYDLLNIIKQGILPALVNYSFCNCIYDTLDSMASAAFALYWKVFMEVEANMADYRKYSRIQGKNAVLTGCCKMDTYITYTRQWQEKTILIAPHHSIDGGFNPLIAMATFPKYADLFLQLPDRYPNIKFIFRPHPALFPCLERPTHWGTKRVAEYIAAMKCKTNVIYSDYGNYFQDFANSDGIIQDCCSFLTEYIYTLKPQCYLLKAPTDIEQKFTEVGQGCLRHNYIAYSQEEIIQFIEHVILSEDDPKYATRANYAQYDIMYNYPRASLAAIDAIKSTLHLPL